MKKLISMVLVAWLFLLGFNAFASESAAPSVELTAHKVAVSATGKSSEKFESADNAKPGDTIEYRAIYHGSTFEPASNVQVTLPVPVTGVEYLIDSSTPKANLASTDGKSFRPIPLMRTETLPNGQQVQRPAPAADYRFLRWNLGDLPVGATRTVRARVQVVSDVVAR